jgi:choline-sulfatase
MFEKLSKPNFMSTPTKPNVIIFMTDQQRSTQLFDVFPAEWIKTNLPNYQYFLDHGVVFDNHICNSTPCGPSRASLFMGQYPATNHITGNAQDVPKLEMHFANVLDDAGYDVYYMGKLHMNKETTDFSSTWVKDMASASGLAEQENVTIENWYKLKKWTSPDFGTQLVQSNPTPGEIATLAGGAGHNDDRVVTGAYKLYPSQDSVLHFLKDVQDRPPKKPFCLVVSLVNPHDISLYPEGWAEAGYLTALYSGKEFDNIHLPPSYHDTLLTKPTVQSIYLNTGCKGKLKPTKTGEVTTNFPEDYLKFYAYLHTLSDTLLGTVLDAIGPDLRKDSILIRMADHGEMAMAHGGLQEKMFTAYNETMRVPMIWMHDSFKKGKRKQLVSLIDLVPTLGSIVGTDMSKYKDILQGVDYSAVLKDENAESQPNVIFNYNFSPPPPPSNSKPSPQSGSSEIKPTYEKNLNPCIGNQTTATCANNIYALVTESWKYAVYYAIDPTTHALNPETAQFELYDLVHDWQEMNNYLPVNGIPDEKWQGIAQKLHTELTNRMKKQRIKLPIGWEGWVPNYSNPTCPSPT